MKANKEANKRGECIRKAINISTQKDFFKFDKKSFNATKIIDNYHITSPKLYELMKTIEDLDKTDLKNYGKKFKHIIYSDVRSSLAGIKLVASIFRAHGMSNIYDQKFKINIPRDSSDNFALLTGLTLYDKPFPVKLKKEIIRTFNERPANVYGENVRFLLIDSAYKEGIDVYDVKYVHLVDDLLTPSDEKQAIGRGTRQCGQKGLEFHPELGWPLYVFKYKLLIDENKYGEKDAFTLFMKESNMDLKKLYFAADLEGICRFGAVDYEINKAIHEFGNEEDDDLDKKDIFVKYQNFEDFKVKIKDMYESLDKEQNGDFKLVKKAKEFYNYGGANYIKKTKGIFKKTKKHINLNKVKGLDIILDKPLKFIEMRKYIRKYFKHLKWSKIDFKSDCDKPKDKTKNSRLLTLNNSQEFISNFFNSKSCYKGMLLWHSVGTGKTCTAVATASNSFEEDDYTILWVTRHSLKSDIWKNIFEFVCSKTIKNKIQEGMDIPETNVKAPLKYLDNKWIEPISYKQFTNLIKKKNKLYDELKNRNGKEDPFRKTLIIIDEAHKLFDENVQHTEKPDINALKKAIQHSYKYSQEDSCKLLLMTATPYTGDAMQLFKLLNLLREDDFFDEDFDDFKEKYLDPETYKFKKDTNKDFLDKISGYISYLNREKDVRQFAYPVIYEKKVGITTVDNLSPSILSFYKLFLEDISDFLEVDYVKCKKIIENIKELIKKPKKTYDVITQEQAFDLCYGKKGKGKSTGVIDNYDLMKEFVKDKEKELKLLEAKGKAFNKELEKVKKLKQKQREKEAKLKQKELEKEAKKLAKKTGKL